MMDDQGEKPVPAVQNAPGFDAYWQDVIAARETGAARDYGHLFKGLDIVATLTRDTNGIPALQSSYVPLDVSGDVFCWDPV